MTGGYTHVRVTVSLTPYELAALLWDTVVDAVKGDVEEARLVLFARTPAKAHVKLMVATRLRRFGQESVCCGPATPYPDQLCERSVTRLVCRVYELDMPQR